MKPILLATVALAFTLRGTAQSDAAAPVRSFDPIVLIGEQEMGSGKDASSRSLELRLPKTLGAAALEVYAYAEAFNTRTDGPQYGIFEVIVNEPLNGIVQVVFNAAVLPGQTGTTDVIRCRYTVVQRLKQFPCGEANFPPCEMPKGAPPVRQMHAGRLVFGAGAADMTANADKTEWTATVDLPHLAKGTKAKSMAWSRKSSGNSMRIVRAKIKRTATGARLTIAARWNGTALDLPVVCNYLIEQ